jgi:hypothetical protein
LTTADLIGASTNALNEAPLACVSSGVTSTFGMAPRSQGRSVRRHPWSEPEA